jgi:hypothetical protein
MKKDEEKMKRKEKEQRRKKKKQKGEEERKIPFRMCDIQVQYNLGKPLKNGVRI